MCGRTPAFLDSRVPTSFFQSSGRPGTVQSVEYLTHDYVGERKGTGTLSYYKRMLVYLPYGYDASQPYNVLVLRTAWAAAKGTGSGRSSFTPLTAPTTTSPPARCSTICSPRECAGT